MGSRQVGRRSTRRRSREERRLQYLDAAADLLAERFRTATSDSAYALAHVRLTEVAARAGVSKGALYHVWPQQEAYWTDLLQAVFADAAPSGESYRRWLATVDDDEHGAEPTIGELFDQVFESRSTNSLVLTLMTLAAYRRDPSIHEAVERQMEGMSTLYLPLVTSILEASGRVLKQGVDPRTLVLVFRSVQDGLVFRHTYSPELFTPIELTGGSFGVFAVVLEALLVYYSEPEEAAADDSHTHTDVERRDVELGSILSLPLTDDMVDQLRSWRRQRLPQRPDRSDDVASRYVGVGLELLDEFARREPNPLSLDGLVNLRISDVAEAVGVSKGSIYHIWSSQDAFRVDVLNHVLSGSNDTSTAVLDALTLPTDPRERIRALSDLAFELLKDDMRFYARFGFTFMSAHPDVTNVLNTAEIEIRERYVQLLSAALHEEGRRLQPSIDTDLVRLCVEAALYGTCLTYRSSPEVFDHHGPTPAADSTTEPSRFAEMVEAMWTHFSEPVTT